MGLFIRQDEERTELQQRIATELQERAKARAETDNQFDDIEKSQYLQGTKRTTSLAWVWGVIVVLAVGVLIYVIIRIGH
jgi:F0F1-type ATP synthase assembly protein I